MMEQGKSNMKTQQTNTTFSNRDVSTQASFSKESISQKKWSTSLKQHEVHEGELTEEEVHGGVKSGVSVDEEDEEDIPTQCCCEDQHDHREKKKICWAVGKDAQEDKVICG